MQDSKKVSVDDVLTTLKNFSKLPSHPFKKMRLANCPVALSSVSEANINSVMLFIEHYPISIECNVVGNALSQQQLTQLIKCCTVPVRFRITNRYIALSGINTETLEPSLLSIDMRSLKAMACSNMHVKFYKRFTVPTHMEAITLYGCTINDQCANVEVADFIVSNIKDFSKLHRFTNSVGDVTVTYTSIDELPPDWSFVKSRKLSSLCLSCSSHHNDENNSEESDSTDSFILDAHIINEIAKHFIEVEQLQLFTSANPIEGNIKTLSLYQVISSLEYEFSCIPSTKAEEALMCLSNSLFSQKSTEQLLLLQEELIEKGLSRHAKL